MAGRDLGVVEENGRGVTGIGDDGKRVGRLVALGQALSDPIRVRMLGMMADAASLGRSCCGLPDMPTIGATTGEGDGSICVCEFQAAFSMGQSKVSYHLGKLKKAGLILEVKRGKWSFYSLDQRAVQDLLSEAVSRFAAEDAAERAKEPREEVGTRA